MVIRFHAIGKRSQHGPNRGVLGENSGRGRRYSGQKRRFSCLSQRWFTATNCKTPSNVRQILGIRKMFSIFRRTLKRRKSRKIRDLRVPPTGIEPVAYGLGTCAKFNEKIRLLRSQVLCFTAFRPIGFILPRCNRLQNILWRSANIWA